MFDPLNHPEIAEEYREFGKMYKNAFRKFSSATDEFFFPMIVSYDSGNLTIGSLEDIKKVYSEYREDLISIVDKLKKLPRPIKPSEKEIRLGFSSLAESEINEMIKRLESEVESLDNKTHQFQGRYVRNVLNPLLDKVTDSDLRIRIQELIDLLSKK